MNPIAVNIKNLRREKGLSQEQFAQALHVTRQTVSAWERGVSQPGLDTLGEMARVLEVEPERLLYGGAGKKGPGYRRVSFWPVLGVIFPFFLIGIYILPWPISLLLGGSDLVYLLSGQLFLAMVTVFCYCSLKDEIRNREYYQKEDEESEGEE